MNEVTWIKARDLEEALEGIRGSSIFMGTRLIAPLQDGDLVALAGRASVYRKGASEPEKMQDWVIPAAAWRSMPRDNFVGTQEMEVWVDPADLFCPAKLNDVLSSDLARLSARGLCYDREGLIELFDLSHDEAKRLTQVQSDRVDLARATTAGDDAKLLVPPAPRHLSSAMVAPGKRRSASPRKRRLRKFFEWADEPIDERPRYCLAGDKVALHGVYTDWNRKQNGEPRTVGRLEPFEKTAFKKWLHDWNAGVRW